MNKLDLTLNEKENARFENIYHDLIRHTVAHSRFTEIEVRCILMVYHKFVLANGSKAKFMSDKQFYDVFLQIFKINDLKLIERVFLYITNEKQMTAVAWIKLFTVFLSDKLEQKIKFVYEIYQYGAAAMDRDVVTKAVDNFFTGDDEEETKDLREDMIDTIFRKMDLDKDGIISFKDYQTVVTKQPLLLEFLGPCLPAVDEKTVIAYCAGIMSKMIPETSG